MLDGQIERELADGEAWCPCQHTQLPNSLHKPVEQEQEKGDIYNETLLRYPEQFRGSSSNQSSPFRETASRLYQLVSYYLYLSLGRKNS